MVAAIPPVTAKRKAEGKTFVTFRKLNHRERRFCALLVQGMGARNAYKQISGVKSDGTADVQAWRWQARPAVQAYLAKLRAEMTEEGALSRAEKRHALANVVRSEVDETRDKLAAITIDNRMTGDDEPFRKAAGDDLRVQFFVVRVGESEADARGSMGAIQPGSVAELNVTPIASLPEPGAPQ